MSLLSGLLAGSTGHPPSRGGGGEGARARTARVCELAAAGAEPEARIGASARAIARPSAIGVLRGQDGAPVRLGLIPQTLRERRAAARWAGRPFASLPPAK